MARTVVTSKSQAKAATAGFTPIPDGDYIAEIVGTKDAKVKSEANKGKPTLDVDFRVVEGSEEGRKFKVFGVPMFTEWASGSVAFLFYQFFGALGIKFDEDGETELPENEELWGQNVGVTAKSTYDKERDRYNTQYYFFDPAKGIKNPPKAVGAAGSDDTEDEFDLDAAA